MVASLFTSTPLCGNMNEFWAACCLNTSPTTRARFPLVNTERMYGPIRCSRLRNRTALPLAVDERFELPNP